jgi:hypothetical protein
MKKILLILSLFAGYMSAQVTGEAFSSVTTHGGGTNSTGWVVEHVFVESGATRVGIFSVDQSPIGIAVTRDAVYDSIDGYHWDSSWTASDFAFLYGYERVLNDSARAVFTDSDSLDFLPVFDEDGDRLVVEADSMRYIKLPPVDHAGAKYMYVEFYDSVGDSLVPQTEPRTLILFYRKY